MLVGAGAGQAEIVNFRVGNERFQNVAVTIFVAHTVARRE